MFIGIIDDIKAVGFYHAGTDIPMPPSSEENGTYSWAWRGLYDLPLDASYKLGTKSYVGAVALALPEASVSKVEILIDGKVVGVHSAESGKYTGGELLIPVQRYTDLFTARLYPVLQDIILPTPTVYGANDDGAPLIYPTPKAVKFLDGFKKIKEIKAYGSDADEIFAASFLEERLTESFGSFKCDTGATVIIKKDCSYEGERYTVTPSESEIIISAGARLPLLYGTDTVLQLYDREHGIRLAEVDDKPSRPFRGFHHGLPHKSNFEFIRRFYRYVLLPLRFNMLIVEFAGGMRFDSHPEISEAWLRAAENYKKGLQPRLPHSDKVSNHSLLEKGEVREFLSYARELGFEIAPEIQSLSHVQYITYAHPEIAEIEEKAVVVTDTRAEDARPEAFYHHCYCPEHPDSTRIIHDIIDEIVEVAKPERYVHIGHDEVYQLGLCKRCRAFDPADIFARHVTELHDYLKKKGLSTMMWADMLHPAPVTAYKTPSAIDRLPKDILLLDFIWYFEDNLGLDIEDDLLNKGFKTAIGNFYSPNYPRFESRMKKAGMVGGELSTWVISDEEHYADNGKFFDACYISEMLWNYEGYSSRNRRTYTHIISKYVQPKMRDAVRGIASPNGYKEDRLEIIGSCEGVPKDITSVIPSAVFADGIIAAPDACYDRLVFEHATLRNAPRIVWEELYRVGDYVITYEDGKQITAPVRYAGNVLKYNSLYADPKKEVYYRHQAYVGTWYSDPVIEENTELGENILFMGFVFENPYPEKKIKRIEYRPAEGDYSSLMLSGIRGINIDKG